MANKTLIIGSSNMDLNVYLKRFPSPGETVTDGTFKQFLGGKGANQAVASARSDADTVFIGKIGMDAFGDQMISQLTHEGININHVFRDSKEASGVAFIMIDDNGENMISVAPGANSKLGVEDINLKADIIKNAGTLVLQMEIPMETIKKAFKIASEGNVMKILNPAPLKPIPPEVLEFIDIIIPNEGELFRLHSLLRLKKIRGNGMDEIVQASRDISRFGVNYIITTLGKRGCLIYDNSKDDAIELPAPLVKPIDTVGAGDCFIGVLAGKLSMGEPIINAVKYATIAASIAVTRRGAQDSMPYLPEINKMFKKLKY
ncbi:MAG: ribokinase [Promethearchaeota archaeon]|jgi:ribokinase